MTTVDFIRLIPTESIDSITEFYHANPSIDITRRNHQAFVDACSNGRLDVLTFLVSVKNIDLTFDSNKLFTMALFKGHYDIVIWLENRIGRSILLYPQGVQISHIYKIYESIIDCFLESCKNNWFETAKYSYDAIIEIENKVPASGRSKQIIFHNEIFHRIVKHNNEHFNQFLVDIKFDFGFDYKKCYHQFKDLFPIACRYDNIFLAKEIAKAGRKVKLGGKSVICDVDFRAGFMEACHNSSRKIIEWLIPYEKKSMIFHRGSYPCNEPVSYDGIIYELCEKGKLEIAKHLYEKGLEFTPEGMNRVFHHIFMNNGDLATAQWIFSLGKIRIGDLYKENDILFRTAFKSNLELARYFVTIAPDTDIFANDSELIKLVPSCEKLAFLYSIHKFDLMPHFLYAIENGHIDTAEWIYYTNTIPDSVILDLHSKKTERWIDGKIKEIREKNQMYVTITSTGERRVEYIVSEW